MSQVQLVFENKLQHSDIIMPLISGDNSEIEPESNLWWTDASQTKIYGILVPIIKINNILISWGDIIKFDLKSTGVLPQVSLVVRDKIGKISKFDPDSQDNELRIQILPAFDGIYKKINLTFFISSIRMSGDIVYVSGVYKVPELTRDRFECFGELSTYSIAEKIATDTKLGFATNCAIDTDEVIYSDKRYMYCNSKSYLDIMSDEIVNAKTDDLHMYDWWVDLWNNINLVNIAERYEAREKMDDMLIWVATNPGEYTQDVDIKTVQIPAYITNHPRLNRSELSTNDYEIVNKHGFQYSSGTDKICTIYMDFNKSFEDTLLINKDVTNDITVKQEYMGEVYGEYNYMLERFKRDAYFQKKQTETIKVVLNYPMLALMRGQKVNFGWYVNDSNYEAILKDSSDIGILTEDALKPLWDFEEYIEPGEGHNEFRLDKTISGQYLITGCVMTYEDNKWQYTLNLTRPCDQRKYVIDRNKLKNDQ